MPQTRRFVDLHTHSTASDGTLRPVELIASADAEGLAAVALTDHDTIDGLAAAQAAAEQYPQLRFIPGIEVSARPQRGTLHILGLGIEADSPAVTDMAAFFRDARYERNPRILAALAELGVPISMADVLSAAGGAGHDRVVGRPHIGQALVGAGYVRSVPEAFERFLGKGGPAYVERRRMSARRIIEAIHSAGGLAAAAHPVQWNCDNHAQIENALRDLIGAGLDAVEAYHSDHTPALTRGLIDLSRRFGLGVVGGSDFHGPAAKPGALLGRPRVPVAALGEELSRRLLGTPAR